MQDSPVQQAVPPTVQVWPVAPQGPASGGPHVPLVLPAGRLHTRPIQQSLEPAHAPASGWQLGCVAQWPVASQMPEQHPDGEVQVAPFGLQQALPQPASAVPPSGGV